MSYDIWLTIDTGGPERAVVGMGSWSYTSNCGPMWRAAGADLAEFAGRPAGECAAILRLAIGVMRGDPATYEAMNPENGWGSYETLLPALDRLLADFEAHPNAVVAVSR